MYFDTTDSQAQSHCLLGSSLTLLLPAGGETLSRRGQASLGCQAPWPPTPSLEGTQWLPSNIVHSMSQYTKITCYKGQCWQHVFIFNCKTSVTTLENFFRTEGNTSLEISQVLYSFQDLSLYQISLFFLVLINFCTVVASLFTQHYNRKMFPGFISVLSPTFLSYPVLSYIHSLYFKSVIPYCRTLHCHRFCSVMKVKVKVKESCTVVSDSFSIPWTIACPAPLSMEFLALVLALPIFFFKQFTYIKWNSWMNGIHECFCYSYLSFLLREQCPSN